MSALLSMDSVFVLLLIGWCHAAANDNVRAVLAGSTFKERINASSFMCVAADTTKNVDVRCPKEQNGTRGLQSNENGLVIHQVSPENARHIVVYASGIILAYYCFVVLSIVKCFAISAVRVSCTFKVFSEDAVRVYFVSKMGEVYRCLQYNLTSNFTGILSQFVNCTLLFETLESVKNVTLRFNVPSINANTLINVSTIIVVDPPAALIPDSWDGFTVFIAVLAVVVIFAAVFLDIFAIHAVIILFFEYRVGVGMASRTCSGFICANAPDQDAVSELSVENPGHDNVVNDSEEIIDLREDEEIGEVDLHAVSIFPNIDGYINVSQKEVQDTESIIRDELPVDDVDNVDVNDIE